MSYGHTSRPLIVLTESSLILTSNLTGWVRTWGVGLPLATGAGVGEGGTLPTAALLLIGTLETRGGAGEAVRLVHRMGAVWNIEYRSFTLAYLFHRKEQSSCPSSYQGL